MLQHDVRCPALLGTRTRLTVDVTGFRTTCDDCFSSCFTTLTSVLVALFVHQNLLKQIPSGVYRGSTWKRTKSVRLVPEDPAADEVLEDWAVEADMLANAQLDGTAIMPAPEMVRRRAALELGLRPFLHGGCVL